ncbi:MAG: EFR1 family ferrodoxin [Lachnospiraceae bacterium]
MAGRKKIILYFSATGNCQYVAARLAQADGQPTLSIVDCIRENRYAFADETIGIMSPTYDWSLPSIVREFLGKASFQTEYLYFVATYGTTPGATGYMAQKAIRGCQISAYYSVRMPDTWTPIFDLSTPEKVAKYTKTTETEIDGILSAVAARRTNRHMADAPRPFSPSGSPSRFMIGKYAEPPICTWRTAASAAGFAPKNARYRPLRYKMGSRCGSRKNA